MDSFKNGEDLELGILSGSALFSKVRMIPMD